MLAALTSEGQLWFSLEQAKKHAAHAARQAEENPDRTLVFGGLN